MPRKILWGPLVCALVCCALPASSRGQISVGPVIWRQSTDVDITSATDFDGTTTMDETAGEKLKDWQIQGSGIGVRLAYHVSVFSIVGEVGLAQTSRREEDVDVSDPANPITSIDAIALDEDVYYSVGARVEGTSRGGGDMFYSFGVMFRGISSELEEDQRIPESGSGAGDGNDGKLWEYEESGLVIDGRIGVRSGGVGLYGGFRFSDPSFELKEITEREDILPELTEIKTWEFERESPFSVVLGVEAQSDNFTAFFELGFGGATTATASMMFKF